jgi:uncharacterized membrane protein
MNLGQLTPEPAIFWFCLALYLTGLLLAIATAPWRQLLIYRERQSALGLAIATLPMLWSMSPGLPGGVGFQLLGMTTVSLIFGWQLALVAGSVAGLVLLIVGTWPVAALPVNLALVVLVPVTVTMAVLVSANLLRRTNLFVYMLGVGFLGSMLALMASLWVGTLLLEPDLDHALVLLLTFPEGFLNGTLISALTVFYPDIVRTYDDVRYLGKPG